MVPRLRLGIGGVVSCNAGASGTSILGERIAPVRCPAGYVSGKRPLLDSGSSRPFGGAPMDRRLRIDGRFEVVTG